MNQDQRFDSVAIEADQRQTDGLTYGVDLWPWPSLRLKRSSVGYRNYTSTIHYSPHSEPPPGGQRIEEPYHIDGISKLCGASESWYRLLQSDFDDESVSIMVGPGEHPVTFSNSYFHPRLFSVWRIDSSHVARIVGYFSTEDAKRRSRRLYDRGDAFAVATSYLWNDGGWDEVFGDDDSIEDANRELSGESIQ